MLRQALFVAGKDVRYLLRDRRQLVWLLIMPPVFMYFIGRMALGVVQVVLGLFFGTVFFGMAWGAHWPMVVVVLLAWGAFCASCGLLLGSLGRTQGQVAGLGTLATMSLAALGGCWWPIEITPEWMQVLQKALPSGWAMDAMHRLVSFGLGPESVVVHITALLAGALVVGRLGARCFRYQ